MYRSIVMLWWELNTSTPIQTKTVHIFVKCYVSDGKKMFVWFFFFYQQINKINLYCFVVYWTFFQLYFGGFFFGGGDINTCHCEYSFTVLH